MYWRAILSTLRCSCHGPGSLAAYKFYSGAKFTQLYTRSHEPGDETTLVCIAISFNKLMTMDYAKLYALHSLLL